MNQSRSTMAARWAEWARTSLYLLVLLLAITVFPQIVLWLPQTMGYKTGGG